MIEALVGAALRTLLLAGVVGLGLRALRVRHVQLLFSVWAAGDHLLTHRAGNPAVPEYAYTDHDFFLTVAPQQNTFITDASGAVVRVVHHQGGQTETLDRLSNADGERAAAEAVARLEAERAPHTEIASIPNCSMAMSAPISSTSAWCSP